MWLTTLNDELNGDEMIRRDWLALGRTALAGRPRFPAHGRASITLIAHGISLVKLIDRRGSGLPGFSSSASASWWFHRTRGIPAQRRAFQTVAGQGKGT